MSMNSKQKNVLKKILLFLGFFCSILIITTVALHIATEANPTTVGFAFLIVVVLASILAGVEVGIAISVVATLFFNYFFFPPVGTFSIADRHNWISLFAFLFTSIAISRVTASANENRRKAENLERTVERLREFGVWLISKHADQVTLSGIAEGAVRIFALEYCSIHAYAAGKWHHFSGTSFGNLNRQIAESLMVTTDHPTKILELAEEQGLGVRYAAIRTGRDPIAIVVVKSNYLTDEAIQTIASMIGTTLCEVVKNSPEDRLRLIPNEQQGAN